MTAAYLDRIQSEHVFTWASSTDSNEIELGGGAFGTLIVPTGSDLIGETLNFVAVSAGSNFTSVALLATGKTLVAGANALTAAELAEVGAVGRCLLRIGTSVTATATLLWKS